ncbi:MAG: hypothetical protein JWL86_6014 [Rhizobium sp.]|nr:hypothetical protein [Rhizobium sp.]
MIRFFRLVIGIAKRMFISEREVEQPSVQPAQPPITFDRVQVVEKTPANNEIGGTDFVEVRYQGTSRWTLFRCPCGCGEVVSLPLIAPHSPRWSVSLSDAGRPVLYPSVWRNKGCLSHFWINDGRVYWTEDTGIEPWVAKPHVYSKRSKGSKDLRA